MADSHPGFSRLLNSIPQEQVDAYEKAKEFAFAVCGTRGNSLKYWAQKIAKRAIFRDNGSTEAPDPHTCSHCEKLVVDPGQPIDPWYALDKWSAMKKVVFECPLQIIEEGFLDGCPLMTQLWVETQMPTEAEQQEGAYRLVADLAMRGGMDSYEFTNLSRLRLQNIQYPWKTPEKNYEGRVGTPLLKETYFEVCSEQDDPGKHIIQNRPVCRNPAENEFMRDIRHWLDYSLSPQQSFQQDFPDTHHMPTRLIRIAKRDGQWRLRLETVNDMSIQYCTLSYCWGLEPSGLTTRANVQQRYSDLSFDALPKTIQDAITVVEKLGFEYLWVDAICIIQEPDDKAEEITKMSSIYGNSVLTICASRALSAEEGFLHPRQQFEPGLPVFKLPFRLPENQGLGTVILGQSTASFGTNRLHGRAWAFQERIMARRILDFDEEATSLRWWEPDGEIHIQDGGALDHARVWSSADGIRARDHWLHYDFSCIENIPDSDFMQDWINRISAYTALDITVPTDRILAIASVAEKAAKLTNGTYLAGLWLKHLPWMLMWSMSDRDSRVPRPSLYQGPSWSWTGVNGQVHCYYPSHLREEAAAVECKVLGYEIDPVFAHAPFGSMKSASLVIQATSRRARWVRSDKVKGGGDYDYLAYHPQNQPPWALFSDAFESDVGSEASHLSSTQVYASGDLLPAIITPDALEHEFARPVTDGGQNYLDVILIKLFRHEGEILGLVVREPEDGVCRRLGIFTTRKGQNYRYARDEIDHDVIKTQDSEINQGNDEGQHNSSILRDVEAEVAKIGSALEKQISEDVEKKRQSQREETDWKRFAAWFDEDDRQEQVFVLV